MGSLTLTGDSATAAAGACAATGAGAATAGPGTGALAVLPSRCWPPDAGAAGRGGAVMVAVAAFAACDPNDSLSLRTTGASIVEDAERTNSPISWSLAITALLSTPNSFASS
jgi:hypothetical protein